MCVAALGLPALISLFSAGVGAVGTFAGAAATKQAADANAAVADANAVIGQRNAEDARKRGVAAEQEQQLRTKALIGKQINILSERNLDVGSGTPLDVIGDTAALGKLDALTTRQNFEREAIAHETQVMNFRAEAANQRNAGRAAVFQGFLGAASTALGGVSDAYKLRSTVTI